MGDSALTGYEAANVAWMLREAWADPEWRDTFNTGDWFWTAARKLEAEAGGCQPNVEAGAARRRLASRSAPPAADPALWVASRTECYGWIVSRGSEVRAQGLTMEEARAVAASANAAPHVYGVDEAAPGGDRSVVVASVPVAAYQALQRDAERLQALNKAAEDELRQLRAATGGLTKDLAEKARRCKAAFSDINRSMSALGAVARALGFEAPGSADIRDLLPGAAADVARRLSAETAKAGLADAAAHQTVRVFYDCLEALGVEPVMGTPLDQVHEVMRATVAKVRGEADAANRLLAELRDRWARYRAYLQDKYPAKDGEPWRFTCDHHKAIDRHLGAACRPQARAGEADGGMYQCRCAGCGAMFMAADKRNAWCGCAPAAGRAPAGFPPGSVSTRMDSGDTLVQPWEG